MDEITTSIDVSSSPVANLGTFDFIQNIKEHPLYISMYQRQGKYRRVAESLFTDSVQALIKLYELKLFVVNMKSPSEKLDIVKQEIILLIDNIIQELLRDDNLVSKEEFIEGYSIIKGIIEGLQNAIARGDFTECELYISTIVEKEIGQFMEHHKAKAFYTTLADVAKMEVPDRLKASIGLFSYGTHLALYKMHTENFISYKYKIKELLEVIKNIDVISDSELCSYIKKIIKM